MVGNVYIRDYLVLQQILSPLGMLTLVPALVQSTLMVLTAEAVKVDSLTAPAVPLLTALIIIQRMLESDVKVCDIFPPTVY